MRIKLDLSEFLEDERKFSVFKVKPKETKTVRDVINKISQRFKVYGEESGHDDDESRPRLGLFDEEFYIHPDETAAVLEDSGVLKLKSLPKPGTKGKKKKKSKKEPVSVVIVEDDERKEEEEKVIGEQEMKNDRKGSQESSKVASEAGSLEGEERKKTSKKRKRCQFAEEVEELQGKKKSRIDELEPNLNESRGEQQPKTWKEIDPSGEKKKRKKEKINRELSISDTSMEEWRGKKKKKKKKQEQEQQLSKHSHDTAGSHKRSKEHVSLMEDSQLIEWKKQRLKNDKGGGSSSSSSQDKVVSNSSFLTTLEITSQHRDRCTSNASCDLNLDMAGKKPCVGDSVMDLFVPEEEVEERLPQRKRKRKHNKRERSLKSDSSMSQSSAVKDAQNAWGSEARRPVFSGKVTQMTFPRKHIIFGDDEDEGGGTKAGPDQPRHQYKMVNPSLTVIPEQNDQPDVVLGPTIVGMVRDISRERRPPLAPPSPPSHGIRRVQGSSLFQNTQGEQGRKGRALVHRRPANNNLDELATLRKICENDTITVCKVDSGREKPIKSREEPRPIPSPPKRRAPPSPPHSALQIVHDSRHSGALQALASLKNRSVPEVFSGVRAMGVRRIQGQNGASTPVRPPLANGSPGPASQNTTILPADDPLQILSSNLSEIQHQYNKGCEQTRAAPRPPPPHSLGAMLSAMKAKPQSSPMDSSLMNHDKGNPRTSASVNEGNVGVQGTSDLLVLDCIEGSSSKLAASQRKKEGLPDIYCVSPSSLSRPIHQASPSRPVSQTSPSKPVLQTSLSRPVSQTSPSRLISQTSPSRVVPQTTPSRIIQPTTPSKSVVQTIPSRLVHPTSLSNTVPQTTSSRLLHPTSPSRLVPETTPSKAIPQTNPTRPIPHSNPCRPAVQPSPSRPFSQSILSRTLEQTSPSRTVEQVKPQNVATPPSGPKWPVDEIVDLESDDQTEVVTCDTDDVKVDGGTVAARPLVTLGESGKLADTVESSKEKDAEDTVEFLRNRIDKNTDARGLHVPNKPASISGKLVEGGMSTGQYIAEILEDCEMVRVSGNVAEKVSGADTQGKVVVPVHHDEIVHEEEVVSDEDEVMLEDDEGDCVEEEEGEEVEEEEEVDEEEEEEGEEDEVEEEVIEEVQDEEEETDIYANIDDDEEEIGEEEEEEEEDFDYEIINEKGPRVSMAARGQDIHSLGSEDVGGSTTVRPRKESRAPSPILSKTLENGDQGQITSLAVEAQVTSILTKSSEATSFVTKPLEVIPVMTESAEDTDIMTLSPEATPVMTKPQEIVPIVTEPEVISIAAEPQKGTSISTKCGQDAAILVEPQEITSASIESQEVRTGLTEAVMTKPQAVTPVITEPEEVTPVIIEPEEVTPLITEPKKVTPIISNSEEVTPVIIEPEEVTPIMTKSLEITAVLKKSEEAKPVSKSQGPVRTNKPGKSAEDGEDVQSEDASVMCQSMTTPATTSTSATNSGELNKSMKTKELNKDAKPAKVSETGMEVVLVAPSPPLQRSPSPEMINVTPAIAPNTNRSTDTHVHTLIHHTTITNIVPSPSLLPRQHQPQHHHNPQHHTPFRCPLIASPPFPHQQPHFNFSPSAHSPFLSLPAQFALGQLMNQSLYQSIPYHNPCPPTSVPTSPACQNRFPPGHLSVAALRGAPLRTGGFNQALQQSPPHPLLGVPLSNLRLTGTPQQRHLMAMINPQHYSLQQNPNF